MFMLILCLIAGYEKEITKIKKKYPETRYIVGVGVAPLYGDVEKCKDIAKNKAYANIGEQIRVKIKAEFIDKLQQKGKKISSDYEMLTKVLVSNVLEGVKLAKVGVSKKQKVVYAVAVLNRMLSSKLLFEKASIYYDEAEKLYDEGKKLLNEGFFTKGLSLLLKARNKILMAMGFEEDARIISGRPFFFEEKKISLSDVDIEIERAFANITIKKEGGDNQKTLCGKGLNFPLKVKIERENKPLVNIPVRFKIEGVDAKYDTLSRTDKNGVAECKVYEIKSEGKGIINASFDTKIMKREIMGDTAITDITSHLDGLKGLFVRFMCEAISPRRLLKILVRVYEEINGKLQVPSVVEQCLTEEMLKNKFNVITAPEIVNVINPSMVKGAFYGDRAMLQEIKDKTDADIIIVGIARSEYLGDVVELPTGEKVTGMPHSRADVSIRAVYVKSGEILFDIKKVNVKGFGASEEEASKTALQKAVKSITEELSKKIEERISKLIGG